MQRLNLLSNIAALTITLTVSVASSVVIAYTKTVRPLRLLELGTQSSQHQGSPRQSGQLNSPFLSFCSLVVRNPNLHDKQIVRTTAILVAGYEQFFLYLPECRSEVGMIWVEDDTRLESNPRVTERLKSLLAIRSTTQQTGRARVTIVGRFIGPGAKRFGHLDQFRMKFVMMRVEQGRAVSRKTPWPLMMESSASVADQIVRRMNKEFVLYLAGAPTHAAVPSEILTDDFSFSDPTGNVKTKADFLETKFGPQTGMIHDTDIEVQIRGSSASVTGILVKSANGSSDERYRYIVTYSERSGNWQVVSAQLTNYKL